MPGRVREINPCSPRRTLQETHCSAFPPHCSERHDSFHVRRHPLLRGQRSDVQELLRVAVHHLFQHVFLKAERSGHVKGFAQGRERMRAAEEDLVRQTPVDDGHIEVHPHVHGHVGNIHEHVFVAEHRGKRFLREVPGRMAHDDAQFREVRGDAIHQYGAGVLHGHARHGRGAGGHDHGHVQLAADGIQRIETRVVQRHAADIRVDGGADETVFKHGLLESVDAGHSLVGIEAVKADHLIGEGLHRLKHAGVGRGRAGHGFAVAAVHDELFPAQAVEHGYLFLERGCRAAAEAGFRDKTAECGIVHDGINNGLDAGTKTKIDKFHEYSHGVGGQPPRHDPGRLCG